MYIVTFGGINTTRKVSMKKNPYHIERVLFKNALYSLQEWFFIIKGKKIVCTCKRLSDELSVAVEGTIVYRGSWKAFVKGKKCMREFALEKIAQ